MIDIALLRQDPELIKKTCNQKNVSVDVDALLELDTKRKELQTRIDELNRARNEAAKIKDITTGKRLKEEAVQLTEDFSLIETTYKELLWKVPNIPSEDTPVGKDDSENVVLRKVGELPVFAFEPKDHETLGKALGIIDKETAAKVTGARFAYTKGDMVLLEQALLQYCQSILLDENILHKIVDKAELKVSSKPFVPVNPPLLIRGEIFEKMARLHPVEERYHLPADDLFLIGSAEHTLGPMHMDQIFEEAELPLRYFAFTSAFRREAGSYSKDTHGLLRLHQFDKLEMESFSTKEQGRAEQDFMVAIQEYITSELVLPYQVMICCTGDQGDPDARHIDIETWMPSEGKYRETHSADYMTDYQARRLNTKVRQNGKAEFVHMNDATVFARTLVAILENYQQADGSILIPEVLQPFMNGRTQIG